MPDYPALFGNSHISGMRLTPADLEPGAEPFIIEIPAGKSLPGHFFMHKGEEMGYLLTGSLQTQVHRTAYTLSAGDMIHLTTDTPTQWKNAAKKVARLMWFNIR